VRRTILAAALLVAALAPTAVGAEAGPPTPTASVDPTTNLVDGQFVTVTADGLISYDPQFGSDLVVAACRLPFTSENADCDRQAGDFFGADNSGHLEEPYELFALLHLRGGTEVDCRVAACGLVLIPFDGGELGDPIVVPLQYDPSAPLLPDPTLTVTPAVDLVDGQVVDVDGTGWRPGHGVDLLTCAAGSTSDRTCDQLGRFEATVEDDGTLHRRFPVPAIIRPYQQPEIDCRTAACSVVGLLDFTFARYAEAPITLAPDGPLLRPTLTVTPHTGLTDGQPVTVEGTGVRPGGWARVVHCLAGATTADDCAWWTQEHVSGGDPRAEGVDYRVTITVHQFLHLPGERQVDCAVTPCALVVADEVGRRIDGGSRVVLGFAGAGPVAGAPGFTG
jgi:hypothetical protein